MTEFYLFLSSSDSVYRKNGFWIEFPKPYLLEGNWTCALTEITLTCDFKPRSPRIYMCSDKVQESYVHNTLIEIVRNAEIRDIRKSSLNRTCVHRIDGGLMMAHEKMIKMEPAIYPYLKSDIKTTSIASGQYSFSVDDVFQGLVPCKLIMGHISSAAYMEDYRKNPFYFRDYDCSLVGFYVDGQS